jgi:hypothetical protein
MNTMAPRWEGRSVGRRVGAAERRPAALQPQVLREGDEICRLSAGGGSVKVCAALTDIKVPKQVNADSQEQGIPPMWAEFALAAADAIKIFEALRCLNRRTPDAPSTPSSRGRDGTERARLSQSPQKG